MDSNSSPSYVGFIKPTAYLCALQCSTLQMSKYRLPQLFLLVTALAVHWQDFFICVCVCVVDFFSEWLNVTMSIGRAVVRFLREYTGMDSPDERGNAVDGDGSTSVMWSCIEGIVLGAAASCVSTRACRKRIILERLLTKLATTTYCNTAKYKLL